MAYIGNPPADRYSSVSYQDLTGGTGTSFTLDYAVGSANEIEVFVNNVRQEPSVAYTVSGTALTMTGTIASTDDFYVVFQGKAQQTVTHPATHALTATDGTFTGDVDINGNELILDADADTKLYASTDDVVKMNIAGSEVFRFDADGLKFNGDTASANALDDYEEGTWTPTDASGASLSFTTGAVAQYVKIGRLVLFNFYITYPTTSSSAGATVGGLPYTVGTGYYYATGRINALGTNDLFGQVNTSSTNITLYSNNGVLQNSTLSGDYALFSGSYITS